MKKYLPADQETIAKVQARIDAHYQDINEFEVTITILMATSDKPNAIMSAGYPALATMRITSQKERAHGVADAELMIDRDRWEDMTDEQQDALIDHELHHLILVRDEDTGEAEKDEQHRPKLKIRKHDYQLGWFTEIAARHGMNSPEVTQARIIYDRDGQTLFPFIDTPELA
jgi:hypothetical protein